MFPSQGSYCVCDKTATFGTWKTHHFSSFDGWGSTLPPQPLLPRTWILGDVFHRTLETLVNSGGGGLWNGRREWFYHVMVSPNRGLNCPTLSVNPGPFWPTEASFQWPMTSALTGWFMARGLDDWLVGNSQVYSLVNLHGLVVSAVYTWLSISKIPIAYPTRGHAKVYSCKDEGFWFPGPWVTRMQEVFERVEAMKQA